jgi:hypothetical protein
LYCCLERNLVFDVHQLFLDFCHNFFTKSEKQGLNLDNLDEQTNLPFIRPEMLLDETLKDLISDLLNIILKNFGEVTIGKLEKDFVSLVNHRFMQPNVLRFFLQKYPQVFEFDTDGAFDVEEGEINDDIEIVRAKTVVELCQAHSADPKSCNGDCNSLHVCRFYILSSLFFRFGDFIFIFLILYCHLYT